MKKSDKSDRFCLCVLLYLFKSVNIKHGRDADELTMIVSYRYSKLEQCEWYINILRQGDKKYIVPQSLEELESVQDSISRTLDELTNQPTFG